MPTNAGATFGRRLSEAVLSPVVLLQLVGATVLATVVGGHRGHALEIWLVLLVAIAVVAVHKAQRAAEGDFYAALAPRLGLTYLGDTGPPLGLTPLLGAGEKRTLTTTMTGPLAGNLGCTVGHYTYVNYDDEGERCDSHSFTICSVEIEAALPVFHGVYLTPRGGLDGGGSWLHRAHAHGVELESTDFGRRYRLLAARDQDEIELRELFAPSFVIWLAEHPLDLGFECKAGALVVYVNGVLDTADRVTLFLDAARQIAARVQRAVERAQSAGSVTEPSSPSFQRGLYATSHGWPSGSTKTPE